MRIGTIVSKHYLAHARVLAESALEHNPDARCTALLVGDTEGVRWHEEEPFEVVTPEQLELADLAERMRRYDEFELAASLKPVLLTHLVASGDAAFCIDSDIRVFDSLARVAELAESHSVVLTPHLTKPLPRDGLRPNEADILLAGSFNSGFVAVGPGEPGRRFVSWWNERLATDCRVDHKRGYFVDQRWLDLIPGAFPDYHALRDPSYNLGYWNLPGVELRFDGERFTVDGGALHCFHFSGFDPDNPRRLSKHQNRVKVAEGSAVARLCDGYAEALERAGFHEVKGGGAHTYRRRTFGERLLELQRLGGQLVAGRRR